MSRRIRVSIVRFSDETAETAMPLTKTQVLPTDLPDQARQTFKKMLAKRAVLFVVLGDAPSAQELASKADDAAGLPDEPRWVVWAKRPADVIGVIRKLKESPPGFKDQIVAGKAVAFTTAFDHRILDAIL